MTTDVDQREGEEAAPLLPFPEQALRLGLMVAVPTGAVFGGFAANTDISPQTALLCWLGFNALSLALIRRQLRELWRMRRALRRLARPGEIEDGETDSEDGRNADVAAEIDRLSAGMMEERARAMAGEAALRAVLDSLQLPVLIFDNGRRLRFLNLSARDLLGSVPEGRDFAAALRNPDVLAAVDRVIWGGASEDAEFQVHQPVYRRLRVRIEPLPALTGAPRTYVAMIDDLTDSDRMREMRSDFVADVSHELRTPLASVLSIVETLNGAARDDPEAQKRFLRILEEQATRMARIVEDLLSLSRIEMHEHQAPTGVTQLNEVLRNVADASQFAARDREMRIEIDMPERLDVQGDAHELGRLFQNLVDNALKYGDQGTAVTVRGAVDGRMARVTVSDRGPGIPREHIPRLTERFYRVDKGRSRAAGGTGLGLAIVKHVVNRHRGNLKVSSVENEGSTFTVELPLAPG